MANELVAKGKKAKSFIEVATLLKDEGTRAKLFSYVDEVVRCQTRILDEKESIKTLREACSEELNIEPKQFNFIVGLSFNNDHQQKLEEASTREDIIHTLLQVNEG